MVIIMDVLEFDFDTDNGFAWIYVESSSLSKDEKWIVQCCLGAENGDYVSKIVCDDCGHNTGMCLDANTNAFNYWGENRCMTALFKAAKKAGFEVVGL